MCASPATAAPKKQGFRLISDYRIIFKHIDKVPEVMLDLEAEMGRLGAASASVTLDLLQGYWECSLVEEPREVFTIAMPKGLFMLALIPQAVLNATAWFQATLQRELKMVNCMTWMNGIIMWATGFDDQPRALDAGLGQMERA